MINWLLPSGLFIPLTRVDPWNPGPGLLAGSTPGPGLITMIDTLGFNTEESQILEGYCDKAVDSTAPSPPAAPSVVPVKIVPKQTLVPWFEFEVSC